tara:strand:- start:2498 stop:2992 length:495 start_codon:yes stop_codon:yes gene_type:complete
MIQLTGKIWFDPKNVTRKHNLQADWKRMAFVVFDGDMCEYYSWFIKKRYNLTLNRPLRGAHISFINDSIRDMGDKADEWDKVKEKYNGTEVMVTLDLDVRSDANHWWLVVEHESRKPLLDIRSELGLEKPYYGMHMTIGYANERNIEHSKYIINLLTKFGGSYN